MTEEEAAEVLALKLRAMQLHAARTPANGSSSAWNPEMPPNPPDDDAVMTAMQAALARPAEERDSYLQSTCAHDLELYRQARNYVEWETRMQGLLLDRFFSVSDTEHPFIPGDILEGRLRIVREIAQGGMGVVFIRSEARTPHRAHVLKGGVCEPPPT